MMLWLLFLTLHSHSIDVFKMNEVSIEYHSIQEGSRIAQIYPYRAVSELGLTVDLTPVSPSYVNCFVHAMSDDSPQVRHVGLRCEVGLRVWKLTGGYLHHSEHILEGASPLFRFPVRDGWFIRLRLL